jgi:hypothetical protein
MIFTLGQLLITLTNMIAHGHADERYAQYSNELWPNDLNFTIGYLLQLFCTLEVAFVAKSKLLFEEPPYNSFFVFLLQGKLCCVRELCTLEKIVGTKPLPKKLLLQMDNYVKDNKNWHFLVVFSLLTAKDVFEEMKLGFLIVGHTHDDIDGYFSYMSKKLRKIIIYVLVDLMRVFMVS